MIRQLAQDARKRRRLRYVVIINPPAALLFRQAIEDRRHLIGIAAASCGCGRRVRCDEEAIGPCLVGRRGVPSIGDAEPLRQRTEGRHLIRRKAVHDGNQIIGATLHGVANQAMVAGADARCRSRISAPSYRRKFSRSGVGACHLRSIAGLDHAGTSFVPPVGMAVRDAVEIRSTDIAGRACNQTSGFEHENDHVRDVHDHLEYEQEAEGLL